MFIVTAQSINIAPFRGAMQALAVKDADCYLHRDRIVRVVQVERRERGGAEDAEAEDAEAVQEDNGVGVHGY